MSDDDFEPVLGRGKSGGGQGRRFLGAVKAATRRAGGRAVSQRSSFKGARLGRGGASGAFQAQQFQRHRRAIVKTRICRLGSANVGSARAHLKYVERDGAGPNGERGQLFSANDDTADARTFLNRSRDDRHQFRIIVAPEDGDQYDDLRPLVRRWAARMERDLGTKLDWIAAEHRDTGHPHVHLILRGKDERGRDLVIAPAYVAHGMRSRLEELLSLDLGPPTLREIRGRFALEVTANRLTILDRKLIAMAGPAGSVALPDGDGQITARLIGRLRTLEKLDLAREVEPGRFRLAVDLAAKLTALGERQDIIRTMQRRLAALGKDVAAVDRRYDHPDTWTGPLVGRLADRGIDDSLSERPYVIIEAIDGRSHFVRVPAPGDHPDIAIGSVVRLAASEPAPRPADAVISEIAASNAGRYTAEYHKVHDPAATDDFLAAHRRRLEALRRLDVGLERHADGSWSIPSDLEDRVRTSLRRRPAKLTIERLSATSPAAEATSRRSTWFDDQLSVDGRMSRDQGFGREVRQAITLRLQWLEEQGFDVNSSTGLDAARQTLRRDELAAAIRELHDSSGLPVSMAQPGDRITGKLVRRLELGDRSLAVLDQRHSLILTPWKSGLEQRVGRDLSISVGSGDVSWSLARGRSRGLAR